MHTTNDAALVDILANAKRLRAALTSGDYAKGLSYLVSDTQATSHDKRERTHCCLGVMCAIDGWTVKTNTIVRREWAVGFLDPEDSQSPPMCYATFPPNPIGHRYGINRITQSMAERATGRSVAISGIRGSAMEGYQVLAKLNDRTSTFEQSVVPAIDVMIAELEAEIDAGES